MAGAAGLCVAVAMPVQAQEGTAPVAVFDQPREGLDPKGLDIGAFRLFLSLTVSETFDDNIFAEENGAQVDLITAVTGAAVARRQWTRHAFPFAVRVLHDTFLDNTEKYSTASFLLPRAKFALAGTQQETNN